METWDAIRARRNVRAYEDSAIPEDALDRILEAGRRAPSANNSQPWDFVLVTGRDELVALSQVWQGARHVAQSAATIVLLAPISDDARRAGLIEYDLGQATIQMAICAADLGIGSGHAAIGDQDLLRELLGHPSDRRGAYLLALGYPADRPLRPLTRINRRPFEEVVHRGRW
ncbi:MAG TPA: nitroreductase family protein [Solirubrobacteraceae bacterium]|jgi:nitroreductase|nr:nitroreductase family protein [Solirubrobacteraceae bacterium]